MSGPPESHDGGEIFVEFVVIGNSVKVTAIDPKSGEEVSIVGPVTAPRAGLVDGARRKLEYVLRKKAESGG